eukprot:882981-Prorocentrum_minimum.AAC.1
MPSRSPGLADARNVCMPFVGAADWLTLLGCSNGLSPGGGAAGRDPRRTSLAGVFYGETARRVPADCAFSLSA